jgi:hypothetical protein
MSGLSGEQNEIAFDQRHALESRACEQIAAPQRDGFSFAPPRQPRCRFMYWKLFSKHQPAMTNPAMTNPAMNPRLRTQGRKGAEAIFLRGESFCS